jgi:hypothetical protein
VDKEAFQKKENRKRTGVRLNIQPKDATRTPEQPAMQPTLPSRRVEREFSQLDDWEEAAQPAAAVAGPEEESTPASMDPAPDLVAAEAPVVSESDAGATDRIAEEKPVHSNEKRKKPASQPAPPSVPMKQVEWVGLVVLAVLIAGLAIGAYFWSIHLLPEKTPRWQQIPFPVKGERVEIKHATTYWRAPVLEGPDKDPIRRGTSLIPVVALELAGGPAALRFIFRDDEGRGVGDPIIRALPSSGKLVVAATAGFEDPGMHAAYRTDELDPWTVEVSEAGAADSPGNEFSLILKMNLSSDLH